MARLMAFTMVSVWALFEPWRGRDDQISIVPFSAVPGVPLHAVKANSAAAASAPTLVSFMHSPPEIRSSGGPGATLGRSHRDPIRHGQAPGVRCPLVRWSRTTGPSQDVGGSEVRCVTDGGAGPTRAARRWPPKRCRILGIGDPNAIPSGAPSLSVGVTHPRAHRCATRGN